MAVYRRKNKLGRYRWIIDHRFRRLDGKHERYRREAQVQTRAAAEAEERRIVEHWCEHGTLEHVPDHSRTEPEKVPTWDDAEAHYRNAVLPTLKVSTQMGYLALLKGNHFSFWHGVPLTEVNRSQMSLWDASMIKAELSASSRRNCHNLFRNIIRSVSPYEDEAGLYLQKLPAFLALPKVGKQEVDAAKPETVERLLGTKPPRLKHKTWRALKIAVALAAFAGLRASEVRALRRRDIDLESRTLTVRQAECWGKTDVPKSCHQRTIHFGRKLADILRPQIENLDPDDLVSPGPNHRPWYRDEILRILGRACKQARLPHTRFHSLRHFFGTSLIAKGIDVRTVQALLGHSSLATTERYVHTNHSRMKAAGKVFDLEVVKEAAE